MNQLDVIMSFYKMYRGQPLTIYTAMTKLLVGCLHKRIGELESRGKKFRRVWVSKGKKRWLEYYLVR